MTLRFRKLLPAVMLLLAGVAVHSEPVDDLVKMGDVFDQRLQAAEALKCYLPAVKLDPKDPQIPTRIARQYRHLMADASSKSEKLRLGNLALDAGRRAAALGPSDSDAQLSVAISYGKMMTLLSSKEQVSASPRVKTAAEKAIALDPRNDLAWNVLGRWHRVLADVGGVKRALAGVIYGSLPVGSNEEAARCLEKAIALNPIRMMHYIELGRVYAQMGRKDDARLAINRGLAMPNVDKDDPEVKKHGRETLQKLR